MSASCHRFFSPYLSSTQLFYCPVFISYSPFLSTVITIMSYSPSSPAPRANLCNFTSDPSNAFTSHLASSSNALSLERAPFYARTLSDSSVVPSTPKKKEQHSKIASLFKPSASRPENHEDLIAISQQLFQLTGHHSNPVSSVAEKNAKDGSSPTLHQLTSADKQRIAKNKKEALKQKRAYDKRVRTRHVNRERAAKVTCTAASHAQPPQMISFTI